MDMQDVKNSALQNGEFGQKVSNKEREPQTQIIVGLKPNLFKFVYVWTWPGTHDLLCLRTDFQELFKTAL